jgi:TonB-dependent SusC/RagA subfamily outer membrane receptor
MKYVVQSLMVLTLCSGLLSCSRQGVPMSSKRTYGPRDLSAVSNDETNQTLDNYLKRIAGVSVNGTGANASVTIRGISSFNLSSEPLFIVDGVPINSYSGAYNAINPMEIKNVRVLKNPSDTGIYGVRGANGVIIITRKNANQ